MNKFDTQEIVSFFNILNENDINYILLRNIENELPSNLSKKKDIDIIVKIEDKYKLENAFLANKWEKIRHPYSKVPYLYSMNPCDFYNLKGLHMANDVDFNKKSFTTGHTGFGLPFMINPDRSDVPRSAGRPLRYIDRYVTVNQGEVFFITEALSILEGIERGPAGNTSLAAAFSLARELKEDKIIIVQETEYTSAGKHHQAQLAFARQNGINIYFGDPQEEIPGKSIVFPKSVDLIQAPVQVSSAAKGVEVELLTSTSL